MKITILLLLLGVMNVLASNSYSQSQKVSLNFKNATVEQVLNEIEKSSEFYFLLNQKLIDINRRVDINANKMSIKDVLAKIFSGENVDYIVYDRQIVLTTKSKAQSFKFKAVQTVITGIVTSTEDGQPLPGVNVQVKGTNNGTITDLEGKFTLNLTSEDKVLVFSQAGMKTIEITIDERTSYNVEMESEATGLNEVVVVGYGTLKKGDVTSAISSIKEKDFTVGAMRDASELIKGKVAGLAISNGSGDPTAGANISLRGYSSLKGGTAPLVLINGVPGNLNSIAPEEIESIDVLKDASAAAIYGTRGANGVIIITTKSIGRDAPLSITYSPYVAVSNFAKKADFVDAGEMRSLMQQGYKFPYPDGGANTDWLSEISGTGVTNNQNISLTGGGSKSSYVVNANYMDQGGVFNKSDNQELKMSADINQYMFNDILKVNVNFIKGYQKYGALGDGYSFNPLIYRNALIRNPTDKIKDDNGKWVEEGTRFQYYNPVAMIEETDGFVKNDWTRLTSNITLTPITGWETNLMVSTNGSTQSRGYSETKDHYSNTILGKNGFASRGDALSRTDYLELTSKYSKNLGQHRFTALAGYSYQYNVNEGGWDNNYDFPTDAFSYNNMSEGRALQKGKAGMDSYKNDNKLIGFFGRVSYGYGDRYNILASIRREGSSKFGENNKWGTFPSVSLGWTLSNEAFMKNVTMINNLKLRAGYGVSGVIPSDSYQSLTLLQYQGNFYNNGQWVKGLIPVSNPNPDLRWEKSKEMNIGLDFSILKNRIGGSIDVYDKKTSDMLWDYSVPSPPNLYTQTLANVGEMENKGFEILLNTTPLRTGDFEWNSNFTFSHNKNELLSLSNDLYKVEGDYQYEGDTGDPISFSTHKLEVGKPIGNFWGFKSVDITDDGKWIIETPEGTRQTLDASMNTNNKLKQYLGNGVPKYYLGWINTFRYKNFDLSAIVNGAFGFQILNFQRMFYENPTIQYNRLSSAYDKVYGKTILDYNQTYVSYYIEDGDYVKLDNVTLGYNFKTGSVKFIKSLRLYASGSNLLTITGYKGLDPEIMRNEPLSSGNDSRDKYPTVRTFTFGLNVTF